MVSPKQHRGDSDNRRNEYGDAEPARHLIQASRFVQNVFVAHLALLAAPSARPSQSILGLAVRSKGRRCSFMIARATATGGAGATGGLFRLEDAGELTHEIAQNDAGYRREDDQHKWVGRAGSRDVSHLAG